MLCQQFQTLTLNVPQLPNTRLKWFSQTQRLAQTGLSWDHYLGKLSGGVGKLQDFRMSPVILKAGIPKKFYACPLSAYLALKWFVWSESRRAKDCFPEYFFEIFCWSPMINMEMMALCLKSSYFCDSVALDLSSIARNAGEQPMLRSFSQWAFRLWRASLQSLRIPTKILVIKVSLILKSKYLWFVDPFLVSW